MDWAKCEEKLREITAEALEGYSGIADMIIQETSLLEDICWFIHTEVKDLEPCPSLSKKPSLWTSLQLRWLYLYRNWRED